MHQAGLGYGSVAEHHPKQKLHDGNFTEHVSDKPPNISLEQWFCAPNCWSLTAHPSQWLTQGPTFPLTHPTTLLCS
jgi:hypothetical protein